MTICGPKLEKLDLSTECPDDLFIVHFVTVVLAWPELVGDEMNYELVIWIPGSFLLLCIITSKS